METICVGDHENTALAGQTLNFGGKLEIMYKNAIHKTCIALTKKLPGTS